MWRNYAEVQFKLHTPEIQNQDGLGLWFWSQVDYMTVLILLSFWSVLY